MIPLYHCPHCLGIYATYEDLVRHDEYGICLTRQTLCIYSGPTLFSLMLGLPAYLAYHWNVFHQTSGT